MTAADGNPNLFAFPLRLRLLRSTKHLLVCAVVVFCLVNVYRSTTMTTDFNSSHEYHRRRVKVDVTRSSGGTYVWNTSMRGMERKVHWMERLRRIRIPRMDDSPPPYNRSVNGTLIPVPLWQRRLAVSRENQTTKTTTSAAEDEDEDEDGSGYYYLAELLQVRIYSEDKARWSVNELKQWMHFLFLAGVQHIYLCDHFRFDHERLDRPLDKYIRLGLVTYVPWGHIRDPMTAQVRCYQRIINRYRKRHLWQVAVDMDEYPYAPDDTEEDFLVRFLSSVPDDVSEVSMANFLMLGRGDRSGRLVIERINRMTKDSNVLVKPIYRPQRVLASVHHNHLLSGAHVDAPVHRLRMLHYWGARSQQWGPDTPKTLDITMEMNEMKNSWSQRLKHSLMVFEEADALTNTTGP